MYILPVKRVEETFITSYAKKIRGLKRYTLFPSQRSQRCQLTIAVMELIKDILSIRHKIAAVVEDGNLFCGEVLFYY
jgi:hypothetical protein